MVNFRVKETGKRISYDKLDKLICNLLNQDYDENDYCCLTNKPYYGLDWFNVVAMQMCSDDLQTIKQKAFWDSTDISYEEALKELLPNIDKVYNYIDNHYTYEWL